MVEPAVALFPLEVIKQGWDGNDQLWFVTGYFPLAAPRILLDLAALANGGGAVNHKGEGLIRGKAKAERVGSKTGLHPESWRNP